MLVVSHLNGERSRARLCNAVPVLLVIATNALALDLALHVADHKADIVQEARVVETDIAKGKRTEESGGSGYICRPTFPKKSQKCHL